MNAVSYHWEKGDTPMSIVKRRKTLIEELKSKKYRDAFVSAQIEVGIPFQIRKLRKESGLTQKKLAEKAKIKQTWISKLENSGYAGFSLRTLRKLASAFDVGLVVRFVPIRELVEWELKLPNISHDIPSYEKDPYFNEPKINGSNLSSLTTASQRQNSKVISISRMLDAERLRKQSTSALPSSKMQDDFLLNIPKEQVQQNEISFGCAS
jgi:transcriptional regulator with XRE-family HTH domain